MINNHKIFYIFVEYRLYIKNIFLSLHNKIITMKHWYYLLLFPLTFCFCSKAPESKNKIIRFDKELKYIIDNYSDSALVDFENNFSNMFMLYYSGIMNGNADSLDLKGRIKFISSYLENDKFRNLYNNVETEFISMEQEEKKLNCAVKKYIELFPNSYIPDIYTHVSPFGYSIVTTDSIISVSLDNYLGSDYKGYEGIFYKYQLEKRDRERIVPDIFKGWLYSKYNKKPKSLIEGMIYEGTIIYTIEYILDDYKYWEIIGYNDKKQDWCNNNEKEIWNAIVRLNHLYSNDNIIYSKYMNEAPFCSALSREAPAEIGKWIGYKIVSKYINKYGVNKIDNILNGDINIVEILKLYN